LRTVSPALDHLPNDINSNSTCAVCALSKRADQLRFMTVSAKLPVLPLMHVGLPRVVADTLREVGVPTAPLPRVPLIANGCGQFVLFDSRNASSVSRVQKSTELGLQPIDLAAVLTCLTDAEHASPVGPHTVLMKCVECIKQQIELRGGVWLRIADFPFPYHSALSVAIGYPAGVESADEVTHLPQRILPRLSHFVSSRSRADQLTHWQSLPGADVGWLVEPEDVESSRRKTLTHWTTRIERFREAGVAVRGLIESTAGLRLPAVRDLAGLGLVYSGQPDCVPLCQSSAISREADGDWVRLATMSARDAVAAALRDFAVESPRRSTGGADVRLDVAHVLAPEASELFSSLSDPACIETLHEWVRGHYRAGVPLFLVALAGGPSLGTVLHRLQSATTRCPLMWQPTLGEFVRWRRLRKRLKLQVWRRSGSIDIQSETDLVDSVPWAIEIWKGNHVASLPLRQPEIQVGEDGLVFSRAETKSCTGISLVPNHPLSPRAKLSFSKSSFQNDSQSHFSHGKDS
jgi:hypothetical protein